MRLRFLVSCAAATLVLLVPRATLAADQSGVSFTNLRMSDAEIKSAISACYIRSLTCHQLIDEIESSSTVVYLTPGQCAVIRGGSCLRFITASSSARYLHVILDRDLTGGQLLKTAAHELQHAVEVVRAPQVVDRASFRRLYERIGVFIYGSATREDFETEEAQRIASVVSKEVKRSQREVTLAFKYAH
jgi:hypothetical protein